MTLNNDWQQGIPLDRLTAITSLFDRCKPFSFGRFGVPNEAEIAQTIVQGEGYELFNPDKTKLIGFIVGKQARRNSIKSTFATGQLFINQHDFVIKHITFAEILPDKLLDDWLQALNNPSIWIETHTEDLEKLTQLKRLGFQELGTKVSASSELKSVLFRGRNHGQRSNKLLATAEQATLERLSPTFASSEIIAQIKLELQTYVSNSVDKGWADHYSSYNIRKSWSAISLKGFTDDPHFIIKPAEMSKKWKQENASLLNNQIRNTPAFTAFPSVKTLLDLLGCETQRIRFMKVRAADGGLSRHADITDKEAGATLRKIARLHIPIQTNPETLFRAWQLDGTQLSKHLETGSLWYLDTRKPHAVSNLNGSQDRIHLVIDAVVNAELQDWIYGKAARLI